ncbi:DUF6081 family protein [Streptomyces albireticuli]|uniref:Uncharacterized protein n=1 Tax=Streptomyces albireticuli TaxID=1940 RepID=A0A2A2DEA3_9ACTN|nr:DUF6081 family protein [Streptomyces albireticuli]MCD9140890.1 DUF6081 family protein [Streptomyces albireticuli]MCD9161148.1 DUF6081 family protein [Streptomyces albireticuli]MCD9190794.1 DUF6081 family protein [Streptomyces albireticuli]PAU49777.1 hypothetical protein CK936_05985 [Streptomyces albireticuli]
MDHGPGTTTPVATARTPSGRPGPAGFRTAGPDRPDGRIRPVGPPPYGDAGVRTTGAGTAVEPEAMDPAAGTSAAGTPVLGHATDPGGPDGHLKWCVLLARTASSGPPGPDAPGPGELACAAELFARVFNTGRHPVGEAATGAGADARPAPAPGSTPGPGPTRGRPRAGSPSPRHRAADRPGRRTREP